jgi:hypothetical protein
MGWKTINGRRYYYKSERDGGRIKTTYIGAGESGLLISLLHAEDREEKEEKRKQRRADREEYLAEEKAVANLTASRHTRPSDSGLMSGLWRRRRSRLSGISHVREFPRPFGSGPLWQSSRR